MSQFCTTPPPGHPKIRLSVITWSSPELENVRRVAPKYYTDLVSALKEIPSKRRAFLVGVRPTEVYILNRWQEFVACIQIYYQQKLRIENFEFLCGEWVRRKHFERPGQKGNKHCCPRTLHQWAVAVCKAYHAVFNRPAVFKTWATLLPCWSKTQHAIMLAVPLYRTGEPKYWMGEHHLIAAWNKWFTVEDCVRISKDFANAVLTPEQQCVLIDKFLYETLTREGEALRHVISGQDDHNRTHIGLYHSNFSGHVYSNILSHGSSIADNAEQISGIVGFNDRQKNQSKWLNPTNNKWYLALDDSVPLDWENKSIKYMTNRWMLSVIFKYEIPKSASEIDIKNKWRPVFPPLSDPDSWYNVTKSEIDKVRRVVYKGIVPEFALGLVSGHCWRGGQPAPRSFALSAANLQAWRR